MAPDLTCKKQTLTTFCGSAKSCLQLSPNTVNCPARHLLLNWMKMLLGSECDKVILVCSERPPEFFRDWLPREAQNRLITVNGREVSMKQEDGEDDIYKMVSRAALQIVGEVAIIVDSLSQQILRNYAPYTCSALHKLYTAENVRQLVTVLHKDAHDENTLRLLQHMASSTVDIKAWHGNRFTCQIRHCRATGKVFKTAESYNIDDTFHIGDIKPVTAETSGPASQSESEVDPTALLPFNLSLTDSEREARSQVKLPYVKESSEAFPSQSSSGRIHYEPDEADDLDEDDPDDDLNI